MKVALSAIGIVLAASLLLATAGAQEAGTNASSSGNAGGSRAALMERVRGLLAESGIEAAAANLSAPARSHRELRVSWEADKAVLPKPSAAQYGNAPGRLA